MRRLEGKMRIIKHPDRNDYCRCGEPLTKYRECPCCDHNDFDEDYGDNEYFSNETLLNRESPD